MLHLQLLAKEGAKDLILLVFFILILGCTMKTW